MSDFKKFSFSMTVPVPVPSHILANDKAEISISVVGLCEYVVYEDGLYPCNVTAFMCPNAQANTPPSAWIEVQTSDVISDRVKFREFYESVEYAINDNESISEYDEAVLSYFTKPVSVEKITTYAAH